MDENEKMLVVAMTEEGRAIPTCDNRGVQDLCLNEYYYFVGRRMAEFLNKHYEEALWDHRIHIRVRLEVIRVDPPARNSR